MARDHSATTHHVEQFIGKLKQPISEKEARQGWTEDNRRRWLKFFAELLLRLKDSQPFDKKERITYIHIARAMDHDGIDGDLTEEAAAISNELQRESVPGSQGTG